MDSNTTLYFAILIAIAFISLMLFLIVFRKSSMLGAKPFSAIVFVIALWAFECALELQYGYSDLMILIGRFVYLGVMFIPVLFLMFSFDYSGRSRYLSQKYLCILFVIPVITLVLMLTNDYHHLFYNQYVISSAGEDASIYVEYGIVFLFEMVFSCTLYFASILVLLKTFLEVPSYYRTRVLIVIIGILFSLFSNLIYVINFLPGIEYDLTPVFYIMSAITIYTVVFMLPGKEIMPVAKEKIIEVMNDCVFLLDSKCVVVEANTAAKESASNVSGKPVGEIIGSDLKDIFSGELVNLIYSLSTAPDKQIVHKLFTVEKDNSEINYDTTVSYISSQDSTEGYLLILRDITHYHQAERELFRNKERYKNLYNNISDGIMLQEFDQDVIYGKISDANDVITEMFGYSKEELFEMKSKDFLSKLITYTAPTVQSLQFEKLISGQKVSFEAEFICKDNTRMPIYINLRVFKLDGKDYLLSLIRNITAEKESRDLEKKSLIQIEKNMEQLSILNDHIRNPLMYISGVCCMSTTCDKAEKVLDQVAVINDIVKKLDMRCLESEKIRDFLVKHYDFDATERELEDKKAIEDAYTEVSSKLDLLSKITHHDILNQLTVVQAYEDLAIEHVNSKPKSDEYLIYCFEKQNKALGIIREHISFADLYQSVGVQVSKWQNAGKTYLDAAGSLDLGKIKVESLVDDIEILADPLLIKVFYNLVDNSLNYGEHVTAITLSSSENEDQTLNIIYTDNGVGIPDEHKEGIFLKKFFHNSGNGMFLSREILGITKITITEMGTFGKGVKFCIVVPKDCWRRTGSNAQV